MGYQESLFIYLDVCRRRPAKSLERDRVGLPASALLACRSRETTLTNHRHALQKDYTALVPRAWPMRGAVGFSISFPHGLATLKFKPCCQLAAVASKQDRGHDVRGGKDKEEKEKVV